MPYPNRRQFVLAGTAAGVAVAMDGQLAAFAQDGDKPTIRVGSKPFTESALLGEVIAQLMEDAGYPVERQLNLGGTAVVHEGMVQDELDAYVEYTGTALLAVLGMEAPDSAVALDASPAACAPPPGRMRCTAWWLMPTPRSSGWSGSSHGG